MALKLYFHPLASYCWKVLIALYDADIPFEPCLVDLGDDKSRQAFLKLSPLGKFPVLHDTVSERLVPESSIIIEYLATHYPSARALVPTQPDAALETRLQDRFFDQQVHEAMQKHVLDKLRPADKRDAFGVEQAHGQLETAYGILEQTLSQRTWAAGNTFTMADCAGAPALYYANLVHPIASACVNVRGYLERLQQRPSFARVLREAQPYFSSFPG